MTIYDNGKSCACGLNKECQCNTNAECLWKGNISITNEDSDRIPYKYAEDRIISDFKAYIDKTYDAHYQTENNVQCFDVWIALGDATPTFRNTGLKYLWRYGKKNGNNKDDLMKTLHYTLMCLYNDHYKDGE